MILQEALRQADVQKLAAATYEYHRAADSCRPCMMKGDVMGLRKPILISSNGC